MLMTLFIGLNILAVISLILGIGISGIRDDDNNSIKYEYQLVLVLTFLLISMILFLFAGYASFSIEPHPLAQPEDYSYLAYLYGGIVAIELMLILVYTLRALGVLPWTYRNTTTQ